eukprot:gene2458-biopygen7799
MVLWCEALDPRVRARQPRGSHHHFRERPVQLGARILTRSVLQLSIFLRKMVHAAAGMRREVGWTGESDGREEDGPRCAPEELVGSADEWGLHSQLPVVDDEGDQRLLHQLPTADRRVHRPVGPYPVLFDERPHPVLVHPHPDARVPAAQTPLARTAIDGARAISLLSSPNRTSHGNRTKARRARIARARSCCRKCFDYCM